MAGGKGASYTLDNARVRRQNRRSSWLINTFTPLSKRGEMFDVGTLVGSWGMKRRVNTCTPRGAVLETRERAGRRITWEDWKEVER